MRKKTRDKNLKKKIGISLTNYKKFDLDKLKMQNIISIEGTKKKLGNPPPQLMHYSAEWSQVVLPPDLVNTIQR